MKYVTELENNQIENMRNETLNRLEWNKITLFLSNLAQFPQTKHKLLFLKPWLEKELREFFFDCSEEMIFLRQAGLSLSLETFDFEMFEKPLKRNAILSAKALYQILAAIKNAQQIHLFFKQEKTRTARYSHLHQLSQNLHPNISLLQKLSKSVNESGDILSTASSELHSARQRLENAKRKIVEHLDTILKRQEVRDALQDNVWMLRDGRYVLPVRTDRKSNVEGIPRGFSQSGSTIFIEPTSLSNEHSALEKAQSDVEYEEQKVLRDCSNDAFNICDEIICTSDTLTTFDECHARAQFALFTNGCKPIFKAENRKQARFDFTYAKHPLFLIENKNCVANDLQLAPQEENLESPYVWVLSGPNAGGKTVAMKTVGVLCLLAKAGLYVSAEKAELIDYEEIFVSLGDSQNREEDLSTFSGHLAQIKRISESAHENSLILLDEGFVGTDPAIGVAMARATLEFLSEKKATVIITTHFSNLKTLSDGDTRFYNGSMEFEPIKLEPTYKLLRGVPGQSYAIELAQRMGLNEKIINQSRKYFGIEAQRMENLIKELQLKNISLQEKIEQQNLLKSELEKQLKILKREQDQLQDLKNSLVDSFREKLQKRFNAYENRLLIRERQFEKHKEKEITDALEQIKITNIKEENDSNSTELKIDLNSKKKNESSQTNFDEIKSKNISKPKTLNSFNALAGVNIKKTKETKSNTNYTDLNLDEKAEKFRAPKYMSSRSLLEEAKMSLNYIKNSYDDIEDDFHDEVDALQGLKKSLNEETKITQNKLNEIKTEGRNANFWKKNMEVLSDKFKQKGIILKEADSKEMIECQFGLIKVKIPHHELKPANSNFSFSNMAKDNSKNVKLNSNTKTDQKRKNNIQDSEIPSTLQHAGNTIDLRGLTVDVALDVLDRELDKMSLTEVDRVVIIHGHGLGKVKESVRKFLEETDYALSFRGGRSGEGGDGATIVEFKK